MGLSWFSLRNSASHPVRMFQGIIVKIRQYRDPSQLVLTRSANSRFISQLLSSIFFMTTAHPLPEISSGRPWLPIDRALLLPLSGRSIPLYHTESRPLEDPAQFLQEQGTDLFLSFTVLHITNFGFAAERVILTDKTRGAKQFTLTLPPKLRLFSGNHSYLEAIVAVWRRFGYGGGNHTYIQRHEEILGDLSVLSRYKGKLVVYMIFNILSIIFGLISLGMLSPFLDILFRSRGPGQAPGNTPYECHWGIEGGAAACRATI